MSPRFTTQTTVDFEQYNRYSRCVDPEKIKNMFTDLLAAFCSVMLAILNAIRGNWIATAFFAAFAIAVYPIIQFWQKRKNKKFYDMTHKNAVEETYRYSFYDDRIEIVASGANLRLTYDQLEKVIETKTNFYLMIGDAEGYMIMKENCSEDLIAFLHEMAEQK